MKHSMMLWVIATGLAGAVGTGALAQILQVVPPPPPIPTGNHYACYTVNKEIAPKTVTLKDQFGGQKFRVTGVTRLCNPVDKKTEQGQLSSIVDFKLHLLCYRVQLLAPLVINQAVLVNNQFGPMTFAVNTAPNELCLPTGKLKTAGAVPTEHGVPQQ